MKEKFLDYFRRITTLSQEEADAIADSMQTKEFGKGEFILKAGQYATKTYFILQGCVREYVLTTGEEKTTNFFTEDQWAINLNTFSPENAATHNWICEEDTIVVVGDEESAQALFKRFPGFETISRSIMEKAFSEQKDALTSYYTDSPEERYLKLMRFRPDLLQRVPQYHLASFIGVKPESLSRIRKRIASSSGD